MSDAPSSGTASGLLAHNVAGIHVFLRNGGMVADPRQDNEIKLIETRLCDKAERIVQVILGAQIRVAILVDTHMSAEEMRLFNLHLSTRGLTCAVQEGDTELVCVGTPREGGGQGGVLIVWDKC